MLASPSRLLAATAMAAVALTLYASTLLPGQDLGDTASFQAIAGERLITPRQGYPLYFAVTGLFVHALPMEAARAANLASAVEAALAVGLLVLVVAELAGSLAGGLASGLLLAGSYTFWSQAVIAEVYSLHLLLVTLCLLVLLAWRRRPTLARLSLFFGLFGLAFGNHLSMVLLLPGFALFLLLHAPGGAASMLRPRIVLLAAGIAAACALQYAWNFRPLLAEPDHAGAIELLRDFWFDVTKGDWRANMVVGIPASGLSDRLAMSAFDLRQQFGVPGVVAAVVGLAILLWTQWRTGLVVLLLWIVNWGFAFTYNVGDAHVFYLPSHLFVALAAGCAAGWLVSRARGRQPLAATRNATLAAAGLSLAVVGYPAWRAYDAFPAMDRSQDRRATRFFDTLEAGLDGRHEILGSDMNWQLHNGLDYYYKYTRPDVPVFDVPETLLYFPLLARDNLAAGRSLALTEGAAAMVRAAYGTLLPVERDPRLKVPTLTERVSALPKGTPYVLTRLAPCPDSPYDPADVAEAVRRLGIAGGLPDAPYAALAGIVGERPVARAAGQTPFRLRGSLAGRALDLRIECWLPADTIRRMGFGHVIVDRRPVLTLDRGVSFVALAPDGAPRLTAWAGGLFSPQARYIIRGLRP